MRGSRFPYRTPRCSWLARASAAFWGVAALTALLLFGGGHASALVINIRDVPPTVGFMSGQVQQSKDGGVTWVAPADRFAVYRQALLRTGGDGSCVLVFSDHSVAAIRPGTTTRPRPPDGPVRTPWGAFVLLAILAAGGVAVLAVLGTFIYLGVNRLKRRRKPRH